MDIQYNQLLLANSLTQDKESNGHLPVGEVRGFVKLTHPESLA